MEKLTGIYRGTVVRHLDYGRMKVFIYGVYPDSYKSTPEKLPTAEQMVPIFGGNAYGNGVYSYPDLNATVICQFLNGDQNFPIVLGTTQGSDASRAEYDNCYPYDMKVNWDADKDNKECKTPSNHNLRIGRSTVSLREGGQIEMQINGSEGNSSIKMDTKGNIFIDCDGRLQIHAKDVFISSRNDTNVVAGNNVLETSKNIMWLQGKESAVIAKEKNVTIQSPENLRVI